MNNIPAEKVQLLDWNQYHNYIDKLAKKMQLDPKQSKYKYIAGVDPDDMIIAVHLGHKLKLQVVTDINILSLVLNFTEQNNHLLVVSNVVETGNSFREVMDQIKCSFDTAVIFKDQNSKFNPTYYVEMPTNHIYFPWQHCGLEVK